MPLLHRGPQGTTGEPQGKHRGTTGELQGELEGETQNLQPMCCLVKPSKALTKALEQQGPNNPNSL